MLPSKVAFTAERPFDIAAAWRYLHAREEGRRQSRFALWQQARADAERIIDMVIARFNPSRIIQWGSVLEPRHFSAISDIDLAIEGVGSIEFLELFRVAEEETEFPLDLVRWENLEPEFQRVILMKGEIRHTRMAAWSNMHLSLDDAKG